MDAKSRAPSSLVMRNVVVAGQRTSVRLEPVMWSSLREIAAREGMSVHGLVTRISRRNAATGLTSAIRVYIVEYYRSRFEQAVSATGRAIRADAAAEPNEVWRIKQDATR